MEKTAKAPAGTVIGLVGGGTASFKGIPYAAPPTGKRRFAPPERAAPFRAPFKAFRFGPMAHQFLDGKDFIAPPSWADAASEDCLSLNVWAPEEADSGSKLPVYVFVHGGGFSMGSSGQPRYGRFAFGKAEKALYDGSSLAREGLIAVTLNYRLGALGFFPSQATFDESGTTGNWALLDQIEALKWVRDNIGAFGGDPENVTLGGESAGSMTASALMSSPLAKGLFRKAILQSGTVFSLSQMPVARGDLKAAVRMGGSFMRMLGLEDGKEGLCALRSADPRILARLSYLDVNFSKLSPFSFSPVRDGNVIPFDPEKRMEEGDFNRADVMVGTNRDEGSLFVPKSASEIELRSMELAFLGPEGKKAFEGLPFLKKNPKPFQRARKAVAYALFSAGAKRLADLASDYSKVWAYRYDYVSLPGALAGLGAHHAGELPFVFGTLAKPSAAMGLSAARLSKEIRARWAAFAKSGDPNPEGVLEDAKWPPYDPASPKALILDKKIRQAALPDAKALDIMAEAFHGKIGKGGEGEGGI
jgi:para-nitrobenzyl esterase